MLSWSTNYGVNHSTLAHTFVVSCAGVRSLHTDIPHFRYVQNTSLCWSKYWTENCKPRTDLGKGSETSEESTSIHTLKSISLTTCKYKSYFLLSVRCSGCLNQLPRREVFSKLSSFQVNYNRKYWTTELLNSPADQHHDISRRENWWRVVLAQEAWTLFTGWAVIWSKMPGQLQHALLDMG